MRSTLKTPRDPDGRIRNADGSVEEMIGGGLMKPVLVKPCDMEKVFGELKPTLDKINDEIYRNTKRQRYLFSYHCTWCDKSWDAWNNINFPYRGGCPHCLAPWAEGDPDVRGVKVV